MSFFRQVAVKDGSVAFGTKEHVITSFASDKQFLEENPDHGYLDTGWEGPLIISKGDIDQLVVALIELKAYLG